MFSCVLVQPCHLDLSIWSRTWGPIVKLRQAQLATIQVIIISFSCGINSKTWSYIPEGSSSNTADHRRHVFQFGTRYSHREEQLNSENALIHSTEAEHRHNPGAPRFNHLRFLDIASENVNAVRSAAIPLCSTYKPLTSQWNVWHVR